MKPQKFTCLFAVGLALTFAVAGCRHKKPAYETPLPSRAGAPTEPGSGGTLPGGGGVGDGGVGSTAYAQGAGHPGWNQNAATFEAQTVYFDLDSVTVKSGEKTKIQIVAAYLQSNPMHAVLVEGHCDERGTEEYNRSLGERRALAAREILIAAGISPDRVDTISYGEDKPADVGHDDAAWRKNRRAMFVLLTPP